MAGCSVEGCDGAHCARGFCHRHYRKFLRGGGERKAQPVRYYGKTNEERFWLYVRRGSGCWEWTGYKNKKGYGVLNLRGHREIAHRVSFRMHRGNIPNGLFVLHRCDNPGCVNPRHLWLGTLSDNNRDMTLKGRHSHRGLVAGRHAKITADDVREIRASNDDALTLAARYGIARSHVYHIQTRRKWRHIE